MQDMADRQAITGGRFWTLFPSVMVPMALAMIDQTIVAAALPAIANALGNVERVSWVVISYLVATTIAAPVYGQLRDLAGSRRMMLSALAIFMVASVLCAMATSLELLALARVLQGLGGGGLMTLSQAMIGEAVPPLERARYQGWFAAVAVTSSTVGPLVGGFLAEHVGGRSIFLVNVPISLIAALLVMRQPAPVAASKGWSVDGWGIAYFALFIVPVLLGIEMAQGFSVPALLGAAMLVALGCGSLVLLIRREAETPHPLLQLKLLAMPEIWRSGLLVACHAATLVALVTWLPVYFRVRFGSSPSDAGLMLLPVMIGIGVGSMITGRLVSRTGLTMIFPSVSLIAVVLLLQVLSLWAGRLEVRQIMVVLLLLGLSMGTVMGVVQLTVQRAAGTARLGAAAATIQFSRSVGAAVGTAIAGAVLFGTLALADPGILDQFKTMIAGGASMIDAIPPDRRLLVRAEIAHAFGVMFLTLGAFACGALAMAWTNPARRL